MLGGQRPEDKGQAWDHPFTPTSPREVAGASVFGRPWLWGPSVRCLSWVLGAEARLCRFCKAIFSAPYHSNRNHFPGNCLSVNIPV